MFAKLLKYDMRATKRYALPIFILLVCLTVVGMIDGAVLVSSIDNNMSDETFLPDFLTAASIFSLLFIIFAIIAVSAIISIMIVVEYYKSTVTDEAYLTFTLPVKSKQILLSKTVNGAIWTLAFAVASIISIILILIVMAIFTPTSGNYTPGEIVGDFMELGEALFTLTMAVIYGIMYIINSILLYFMAITLSSTITRKNRILCAIGCIIGVNFAYGIINNVIDMIISLIGIGIMSGTGGSAEGTILASGITLLVRSVIIAGFSVLFFYFTNKMLDKKLNLA